MRCLPIPKPWNDPRYFFGAPTRDQAKRIAWQDLKDLVPKRWVAGQPNETELMIKTRWGAELHVAGMDRPERIEGVGWDGCVLDESSDMKPKAFDLSVYPALTDRQGWCWFIGVPKRKGPGAAEYRKRFQDAIEHGITGDGSKPRWAAYTWFSSDILPPEEIAYAQQSLDPKDYREQFEGAFETAGGGVYYAFEVEYNVRPCAYNPDRPVIVGSDFNVDPMAWVLMHSDGPDRRPDRLDVFDEIYLRDTNTRASLDVLYGRYSSHKGGFRFYGDATGRARKTSASQSDYQIILGDERFKRLGRTVHYPKANPLVADRHAAVNAMLLNAAGERRLFVDPRCEHLIDDLESCHYKPGTSDPETGGDLTHPTDALGYPVHYMRPVVAKSDRSAGRFSVRVA